MFLSDKGFRFVYQQLDSQESSLETRDALHASLEVGNNEEEQVSEHNNEQASEQSAEQVTESTELDLRVVNSDVNRTTIDTESLLSRTHILHNENRRIDLINALANPDTIMESSQASFEFLDLIENNSNYIGLDGIREAVKARFQLPGYDETISPSEIDNRMSELLAMIQHVNTHRLIRRDLNEEMTQTDNRLSNTLRDTRVRLNNRFHTLSPERQGVLAIGMAGFAIFLAIKKKNLVKKVVGTAALIGFGAWFANSASELLSGRDLTEWASNGLRRMKVKMGEYFELDADDEVQESRLEAVSVLVGVEHREVFSRSNYSISELYNQYTQGNLDSAPIKNRSYFATHEGSLSFAVEAMMTKFGPGSELYQSNPDIQAYMDEIMNGHNEKNPRDAILDMISMDENNLAIFIDDDERDSSYTRARNDIPTTVEARAAANSSLTEFFVRNAANRTVYSFNRLPVSGALSQSDLNAAKEWFIDAENPYASRTQTLNALPISALTIESDISLPDDLTLRLEDGAVIAGPNAAIASFTDQFPEGSYELTTNGQMSSFRLLRALEFSHEDGGLNLPAGISITGRYDAYSSE